ncbi:MAG: hypothetical protein AAF738_00725 [Bacteroidota bacterium]
MKNVLFLLLLSATSIAVGQTCTVSGQVMDAKDQPINNVRVKVGNSIAVYTDSDGTFSTILSLKNHLNTRVKVTATRRGYATYTNNSLIIKNAQPIELATIRLLREGERIYSDDVTNILLDNVNLISDNNQLIQRNQAILRANAGSISEQYRSEIQDMEYTLAQLEGQVKDIKLRVEKMNAELSNIDDKWNTRQGSFIQAETKLLDKQERLIANQERLVQVLSKTTAKDLILDNSAAKYIDDSTLELSFLLKDALGSRPQNTQAQLIGIEVHQLEGKSRTKVLLHMPESDGLESSRLRKRIDISRLNRVRFKSTDAFKRKNRKMGYVIYFYLGEHLLGVQGYRF